MARFGINPHNTLGVAIPLLRRLAKEYGRNHDVAMLLWDSRVHEARILASMIDDAGTLTNRQMDRWTNQFDSWDVCDQCCANLYEDSPHAWKKAREWSASKKEFVKRAGFVMMARLAVSKKEVNDNAFHAFFERIEKEAHDDRPMVRKAVNWALRQIGKRSEMLHQSALTVAERLSSRREASARWIGADAARELRGATALNIVNRHEHQRSSKKP